MFYRYKSSIQYGESLANIKVISERFDFRYVNTIGDIFILGHLGGASTIMWMLGLNRPIIYLHTNTTKQYVVNTWSCVYNIHNQDVHWSRYHVPCQHDLIRFTSSGRSLYLSGSTSRWWTYMYEYLYVSIYFIATTTQCFVPGGKYERVVFLAHDGTNWWRVMVWWCVGVDLTHSYYVQYSTVPIWYLGTVWIHGCSKAMQSCVMRGCECASSERDYYLALFIVRLLCIGSVIMCLALISK